MESLSKNTATLNNKKDLSNLTNEQLNFYNFHGIQLLGSNFPVSLIPKLFHKLKNKIYDAGEYFQIFDNNEKDTYELHALKKIPKNSQVFIIDHAISFRYPELRTLLQKNQQLIERIQNMTAYSAQRKNLSNISNQQDEKQQESIQYDSVGDITNIQFPENTICLSLVDNGLEDEEFIIKILKKLPQLRALWLNTNPIQHSATLKQFIQKHTKIQLYNSKLTRNATTWIFKYLKNRKLSSTKIPNSQVYYVNVDDRQIFNLENISKILLEFPNLRKINLKGHKVQNLEDLNKLIQILKLPSLKEIEADHQLELTIFELFKVNKIQNVNKNLFVNKHNIYLDPPTQLQNSLDQIHQKLFKLTGCYRLASTDKLDQTSIWYLNDELGSSITHSDNPEVILSPFLYAEDNKMTQNMIAFTIMWNIKDLDQYQVVERDYLSGLSEQKQRSSRLAVWYNLPRDYYLDLYQKYESKMKNLTEASKQLNVLNKVELSPSALSSKQKIKVLTDSPLITQFLTLKQFEFTMNLEDADILWIDQAISQEFQRYKDKYVNQFPYEACLVMKTNLAKTIQQTLGNTPFLQRTYDLQTQLPYFLGHYYHNEDRCQDNLWISKPPNMARSMDMLVSDNLDILIRNMETGPKLVQKYISHPVRRLNRKIDLRYIVLLRSVNPLKIYLYRHFWIRTSNNQYNLDCRYRELYETHFTVMNYGKKLTQVFYPDFINQFNEDYKPLQWNAIQEKIKHLLRQTFRAASIKHPQMQSKFSRAVYGVDIMVDEQTMEPKLLQLTFAPDCNRACKFYPTFYNDLFQCLFLDRVGSNVEELI